MKSGDSSHPRRSVVEKERSEIESKMRGQDSDLGFCPGPCWVDSQLININM